KTSVPAGANYTSVTATAAGCGLVTVAPPAPTNFVAFVGPPGCSAGGSITFTEQPINAATGHTVTQPGTTRFGGPAVAPPPPSPHSSAYIAWIACSGPATYGGASGSRTPSSPSGRPPSNRNPSPPSTAAARGAENSQPPRPIACSAR